MIADPIDVNTLAISFPIPRKTAPTSRKGANNTLDIKTPKDRPRDAPDPKEERNASPTSYR